MKIKVCIVDDHTIVRDGLQVLLEAQPDINVVGNLANGRAALSHAQVLHPDVILMDISMPDLSGIETTRLIWERTPQVRVIILSMLGTPEHIYRALEAGARGYLLKESAGREVVDAVRTVYAGDIYLSQPVIKTLVADYIDHRQLAHSRSPLESLSQREREILPLVVDGKTSSEIAQTLYLSPKTVESYRSRMMRKLDLPDTASLIRWAVKEGLKD
ncbi:MAG: DNA-binding response regulator [Chloroflexi bacterium RBG_16_57_11]|nr:MAG: DNA-binding response regulator [Chloroflexi bacterium RBG_16_57_11]